MALNPRHLTLFASNGGVSFYTYSTADAAASVLAAGYFNAVRANLMVNDVVIAMCQRDVIGDLVIMRVATVPSDASNVTVVSDIDVSGSRAVVPTADGLTTGLLTAADKDVVAASANSAHILTLPPIADMQLGQQQRIFLGATAANLKTVAASGTKINNVDSGGAAKMVIPASSMTVITKLAADNYMVECYVAAGTRTTPAPA